MFARACVRARKNQPMKCLNQKKGVGNLVTLDMPFSMPPPSTDWIHSAPIKAVEMAMKNLPLRVPKRQVC